MLDWATTRTRELQDTIPRLFTTKRAPFGNHHSLVSRTEAFKQKQTPPLLLSLPPEIRNLIFALVLGHNSLHVYAREITAGGNKANVDYFACTVPHPHKSFKSGLHHPEWLKQHMPCFTNGSAHLPNTDLIFTCRQIYAETRLLPYSSNEFIFVAPSSLEIFAETVVTPTQAQALRTLSIWMPLAPGGPITTIAASTDSTTMWNSWTPSPTIVDRALLTGVQELRLCISVFANDAGDSEWMNWREIQGLFAFMGLSFFQRVTVAVGYDEESGVVDERAVIEAYAEEIREKMLGIHVPGDVVLEGK